MTGTLPDAPPRVVIVDDDEDVRAMLRRAFELGGGFDVVGEAPDGEHAISVAGDASPDVVVLDLGLPDLAGGDVITRLRDAAPRVRVVVYTGRDERTIADEMRERGAMAWAVKGVDVNYLIDLVGRVAREPLDVALLKLECEPQSAALARAFVSRACERWVCDGEIESALHLVVSELVTNAVLHARSRCDLRLERRTEVVRVEVVDAGSGTPDLQQADEEAEHGRGLLLVSAYSEAWGVYSGLRRSKVVWAEVAAPSVDRVDAV